MKNKTRKTELEYDLNFLVYYQQILDEEKSITAELKEMEASLLKKNLAGYGVGYKRLKGMYTNELCAVFFVKKKVKKQELPPDDLFPSFITVNEKKIRTDVVEIGEIIKTGLGDPTINRQKHRPVLMGAAITIHHGSGLSMGFGTAGAKVKERNGSQLYLLSAGHVYDTEGFILVQPDFGAFPNDQIGAVVKIAGDDALFGVDAGIAEISASKSFIISIGLPNPALKPVVGLNVQKSGARTGHTQSSIYYTNVTLFNEDVMNGSEFPIPDGTGLFFVLNASPNVPNRYNPYPLFGNIGDSGALIVTGWANDPTNLGPAFTPLFDQLRTQSNGKSVIDSIVRSYNRCALGLYIENIDTPLYSDPSSGYMSTYAIMSFSIGQEISYALDALDVDLVLS